MNPQESNTPTLQSPPQLARSNQKQGASPLVIVGATILCVSSMASAFFGNIGDFHSNVLAGGFAANKESSSHTWFVMNVLESLACGGFALGFGLISVGIASMIGRNKL